MRVWGWLAAALVWLLAVAVVAAVAWFAMDSAGREVAGADGAVRLVAAAQPSGAPASTAADVTRTPPSSTPSVPGSGGGRTGTYSSEAGDVVVRCAGDSVAGWAMRAADGWRAEAAPVAGGRLKVLFVAGDGRLAGVEAGCQDGEPALAPARQSSRG